jgi:hypothetical protein
MTATERGALIGIRPVPADPDPREFSPVLWACEARPALCGQCFQGVCKFPLSGRGSRHVEPQYLDHLLDP